MRTRPPATISVDLDPVDVHLRGYGHEDSPPDSGVHERALPRLLELFARRGVRATFFVLARDVQSDLMRLPSIVEAGHEVASHGVDHRSGMARIRADELRRELDTSRATIASAAGAAVIGFRAPDWSAGPRLVPALADTGYSYDASLVPTPVLVAGRLLLAARARRLHDAAAVRPPPSYRRRPFRWTVTGRSVIEFPLAVTPRLRLPLYHTIRPSLSDAAFERHLDGFAERREPLSYALHGVDALGLNEDRVDGRLAVHPGMRTPLEAKLELLDRTVAAIVERFQVRPFRDRVPTRSDGRAGGP